MQPQCYHDRKGHSLHIHTDFIVSSYYPLAFSAFGVRLGNVVKEINCLRESSNELELNARIVILTLLGR